MTNSTKGTRLETPDFVVEPQHRLSSKLPTTTINEKMHFCTMKNED